MEVSILTISFIIIAELLILLILIWNQYKIINLGIQVKLLTDLYFKK